MTPNLLALLFGKVATGVDCRLELCPCLLFSSISQVMAARRQPFLHTAARSPHLWVRTSCWLPS